MKIISNTLSNSILISIIVFFIKFMTTLNKNFLIIIIIIIISFIINCLLKQLSKNIVQINNLKLLRNIILRPLSYKCTRNNLFYLPSFFGIQTSNIGLPSGHSQIIWTIIISCLLFFNLTKTSKIILILMGILVSISRLGIFPILGVKCHTTLQVILGGFIGAFIGLFISNIFKNMLFRSI